MKCPKCQFENPEGAKFCSECGHGLLITSKTPSQVVSFDGKLEKIQRYLPKGLIEKILAQRDKIEDEQKQVTVSTPGENRGKGHRPPCPSIQSPVSKRGYLPASSGFRAEDLLRDGRAGQGTGQAGTSGDEGHQW